MNPVPEPSAGLNCSTVSSRPPVARTIGGLVHAGFYGPATGAQHARLVREFEEEVERLLSEK